MTIVIPWTIVEFAILLAQIGVGAYGAYWCMKAKKAAKDILASGDERAAVLEEWTKKNQSMEETLTRMQPEEMAASIQRHLVNDVDAFARILEDFVWLHEQLYATVEHPPDCPSCTSSAKDLEDFIDSLRAVQVMPGQPGEEPPH